MLTLHRIRSLIHPVPQQVTLLDESPLTTRKFRLTAPPLRDQALWNLLCGRYPGLRIRRASHCCWSWAPPQRK